MGNFMRSGKRNNKSKAYNKFKATVKELRARNMELIISKMSFLEDKFYSDVVTKPEFLNIPTDDTVVFVEVMRKELNNIADKAGLTVEPIYVDMVIDRIFSVVINYINIENDKVNEESVE